MKKILVLSASPRKGGNSDLLCDEFIRGAADAGNSVEKLWLSNYKINYCTGCGLCSEFGRPCPQQDDMAVILEKMIQADVIVMATPVYFYTMNAQMKTLIDRTCARYTEINHKEFYYIITAAETDLSLMSRTIEGFRGFTDCLEDPVEKGILYGVGAWKIGEIKELPVMSEAYEMGRNA